MIAWLIGVLICLVGFIGFLVSLIICTIKRDWGITPLVWGIVLNIGNVIVQISRLFIN